MMKDFNYPVINMIKTGENIMRLRKEHKMSVKYLQDIFGFTSPMAIYKWQQGKSLPDIANLSILARLWDVPIEKILVYDD